ncbi:MFS transporter [Cellvibrio polysaccharolyticus]|uniref:MFS transporter n=1 Tax=Cellvibrio polysaccharolyticus TaxID=2082724 RepID=A0A928V4U5_9GAMM|nr:glycoside-pentoside-hexuronide (GPH):cation symporter [Cellvibrio polysaccharolyticus]MBE8716886.1 MFS transporter [Cellvibrio polysaccharolyticus]
MAQTSAPAGNGKIKLREKIGYGIGDMGFNFYWANISAFLLIFYTDVMGLSAAAVGTMILITKIIDAFTDPLMGAIADRTKTRFGKFRPYLLFAALPMAGAGILTYSTPDLDDTGKLIWAYATYSLMMLVYTVLSTPYSALSGVITADSQERTTLISFRFIAAFTGTTIVNYFTLDMVQWFGQGNDELGWQLTMGVYGIAAAVMFMIVFFTTKERVEPPAAQQTPVMQDIRDLLGNGPWLVLFALALIIMITIVMRAGSIVYYLKYYVERPELTGTFLGVYSIALALGAACTPIMTRYMDKKNLMILLMAVAGSLSCLMFFVPKDALWMMFVLNTLIGFALGPKSPLAFSMYADSADYTEWKTGRRATAMTFSAATFSQKLGGAMASAAIAWTLALMGYVANEAQSDASQLGIVLLVTIVPGVIAFIAAFVMRFYTLDSATLVKVQQELLARKLTS